jgi:tetratricopeptide (TPR) repeat protein
MQFRYLNVWISSCVTFLVFAAAAPCGFAATAEPTPAATAPLASAASSDAASKAMASDTDLIGLIARFLARQDKETFAAAQIGIIADRHYDQTARGLDDMLDLYRQKQYRKALDRFQAASPDLALSPQAHFYASRCYEELGQKDLQKKETSYVRACLKGLLATGDGSPEHPFVVTHASDEYDLLACPLKTESKSLSTTHRKGRWYDVLECANGKTYWFDITQTFGRTNKPAAPETAKPAAKPAAKPSDKPTDKGISKKIQKPARKLVAAKEERKAPAATGAIPPEAFAAFDRGADAIKRRDYDRAIAEFNEVLRLDPNSADALFERGVTYIEKHNYAAACDDLSRSIQLRPGFALTYYERGLAIWRQGDQSRFDEAIADFSTVIRLIPSDFVAWRSRAMLWFAKRDYRKAIDDFNEAIRLQPDDVTAHNNRGFAYESVGEYSQAIADFNLAIRLQPQSAPAYAGRGLAWVNRGEYDLAIADLNEAVRLQPDYAAAYSYRSSAYAHKGDQARAQSDASVADMLRSRGEQARSGEQ